MKLHVVSSIFFFLPDLAWTKTQSRKLRKSPKRQHFAAESRIVGGSQASPGEYPFFVEWGGCGASLIHDDIIISAAHCNPISSNTVLIGAYRSNSRQEGAEFRSIIERRPHPAYNDNSVENDFLVMKINEPSGKPPIRINSDPNVPLDNDQLTVMGFGTLNEGGAFGATLLQEVNVQAVSRETCNSQYDGDIVEDIMLCAGVQNGGKDSCQGDSGGPLIDSDGAQVGVVSWGYGCGRPNYPGVYARISGAIDWINGQICDLSDNPPDSCATRPGITPPPGNPGTGNGTSPPGNPGTGNGNPPPNGTVRVRITMLFDNYPQEAGLEVTSLRDSNIVVDYPTGSFSDSGTFIETVDLVPGEYEVKLTDSFGDGLCCEYGEGSFQVHALVSGKEELLAQGYGIFADSIKVNFSVPAQTQSDPPTAPPTSESSGQDLPTYQPTSEPTGQDPTTDPPTREPTGQTPPTDSPTSEPTGQGSPTNDPHTDSCQDQSGIFLVDSEIGDADCEWLAVNLVRYNYLCQFLDVASECRKSCDVCEYFESFSPKNAEPIV